tara:strand:- start:11675 stop:12274 length:600 start_codon:yes stop_codon:yes gene_type:complete
MIGCGWSIKRPSIRVLQIGFVAMCISPFYPTAVNALDSMEGLSSMVFGIFDNAPIHHILKSQLAISHFPSAGVTTSKLKLRATPLKTDWHVHRITNFLVALQPFFQGIIVEIPTIEPMDYRPFLNPAFTRHLKFLLNLQQLEQLPQGLRSNHNFPAFLALTRHKLLDMCDYLMPDPTVFILGRDNVMPGGTVGRMPCPL